MISSAKELKALYAAYLAGLRRILSRERQELRALLEEYKTSQK